MPIVMPEEQTYELVPPGSHTAVCFRVVDCGTQPRGMYGPKWQVLISWETPDELMANGQPFTISRRYTLSSNRKSALRGDIEGWLGRVLTNADFGKFDLSELLGTTCIIGIKHETREDGRIFANVTSVMKRPKAVPERMPCINPAVAFSLADRPFREHEYDQLPQWLRDLIARSPEFEAATKPQPQVSAGTQKRLKAILADSPAPKSEPVVEPLDDAIPF
jgi:hypothetical protein